MAIYTTLFSATLSELEERFPNVANPLDAPRIEQRTNPFTREPISVQVFEPEFGKPRHQRSLFVEGGSPPRPPIVVPDDVYGRYLDSLVPAQLRSLPHVGTKNVSFDEAEDLLELDGTRPEKFVQCLPGEGAVDVASAELVSILLENNRAALRANFQAAWDALPLDWMRTLLRSKPRERRYLCAWYRL